MTSPVSGSLTGHPIADFAERLHTALNDLAQAPAWSMSPDEQRDALVQLTRGVARVEELRLRVLAAADRNDVGAEDAAVSTSAWLAARTRRPHGQVQQDVRLAVAMDESCTATRDALASGAVDVAQAQVIVRAVRALREQAPDAVACDATLAERAEKHLLQQAAQHDATVLRRLGRHVLEVVDPHAADLAIGKRLEADEAAASRSASLELFDNGDGTHAGRFKISDVHAAMLRKALETFTGPTHRRPASSRRPSRPELMGQAFGELLERIDPARLPRSGGVNATVVVTIDYDTLVSGLGSAELDTGEPISAGLARRLACQAGVIPAVLRRLVDGRSVVLDMGRKRRLFTEHQRIALGLEQGGCTAEACDRPAAWSHAHHDVPWSGGGGTDLANGRLLCPFHHGRAHSTGYRLTTLPSGQVRFHRRT